MRGCLGSRPPRRWFADPEHPQPGQEERPQGHEHERGGVAHVLKKHATDGEYEDGGHAGDQAKGRIGLTTLRGRKEIAQPGHHRWHKEGAAEISHENGQHDTCQCVSQGDRD